MSNRNQIVVNGTAYGDEHLFGGVKYRFDLCEDQLTIGATPSAEIKFTMDVLFPVGTEVSYNTLFDRTYGSLVMRSVGVFYITEVTRNTTGLNRYDYTAYDVISLLDKPSDDWMATLTETTYTVSDLMDSMTDYLDLSWTVPLSSMAPVNLYENIKITWAEQGLTYRQILGYFAGFCGGFACASDEDIMLACYCSDNYGTSTINNDRWTTRTIGEYSVPVIDQFIARDSEGDIGVSYPDSTSFHGTNIYVLEGNPVWYNDNLTNAAHEVYDKLNSISAYTPCNIKIFNPILSGIPFVLSTVKDSVTTTSLITSVSWDLSGCTYTSVGYINRGAATESFTNYENKARYNKFTRDINETKSEIATLDGRVTTVKQTADEVSVYVKAEANTTESETAPTNPNKYDMWKNTSVNPATYWRWDGSTWNEIEESDYKNTSLINSVSNTATGVVFRSNLTDGVTTISGNNITSGTISGNRIDATTINANDLNMSGRIAWGDLTSAAQSRVDSGKGDPNPSYIHNTYISATEIQSPTIKANEFDVQPLATAQYTGSYNIYGYSRGLPDLFHFWQVAYYGNTDEPEVIINSPNQAKMTIQGVHLDGDESSPQIWLDNQIVLEESKSWGTLTQRNALTYKETGQLFFVIS